MAARVAGLALRSPTWVLSALLALSLLAALGATQLKSVSYLEGHLPPGDLELARFEQLQREFGSDRLVVAAAGCILCSDVLEPDVVATLAQMTRVAEDTAGVLQVSSLANVGLLVGDGSVLRVERLSLDASQAQREAFKEVLLADPLASRTLVSSDLRTAGFVIRFDPSLPDAPRNVAALTVVEELRQIASDGGLEFHATGDVVFGAVTDGYVKQDLATLTPIMMLVIIVLLTWVFRSLGATVIALAVVAAPALWAFGLMGWSGRPLTPVATTLPVLILVVGITDAIHFLVRSHDLHEAIPDRDQLIEAVAREVGPPTTVTAATGALGFLSLLAGPLPALQDFGLLAAIGILGAWLATFSVIPIAIARWGLRIPVVQPPAFVFGDRLLAWGHRAAHRHALVVMAATLSICLVSFVGISRVVAANDGFKLVGEGDPIATSDRYVRERLRGAGSLEVVFEPKEAGGLLDVATLQALARAESLILQKPDFGPASSLLTILRLGNREIAGDPALPATRQAAAQLLLLAEAADPDGVRNVVSHDQGIARISVSSRGGDIAQVSGIIRDLREELGRILDSHGSWYLSGALLLALHQGDLVLESQVASFSMAFLTIFVVLVGFLRSPALGALGMVPNVLPVAAILGFMGFASINLDVGTAMIASIVLGVSVDDTVYFLIHYRRARRNGANVQDATAFTFAVAGRPALFSAGMLAVGFFVLGLSSFQSLAIFGFLSGVAVSAAVATELAVLPAMLEILVGRQEEQRRVGARSS